MTNLYHGKPPNRLQQIQLLAQGHSNFSKLYATKKKDTANTIKRYKLKEKSIKDTIRVHYADINIISEDLNRNNRNAPQLISGCSLVETTKKGMMY